MKITIACIAEEEREAHIIQRFVCRLCDPVKVHESDAHPPFKHIYLTSKTPLKSQQSIGAQGKMEKEGTPYNVRSREETP